MEIPVFFLNIELLDVELRGAETAHSARNLLLISVLDIVRDERD